VQDIITTPPLRDHHDPLKAELVSCLSTSREQLVKQLLSHKEMGDMKPSQFLRQLKGLALGLPADFLHTIWVSWLPPHVQPLLAGQTKDSLDSASKLTDRVCEVTLLPTTAAVSASTPEDSDGLRELIDEFTRLVASLQAPRGHSRSQFQHSQT
jgi:hypothetical protein